MTNPPNETAVTALKQIWRKDAPVVFDVPQRITNSSSRAAYTGNRMESPRGEAGQADGIRSFGTGC